jgi:hypothetical protein
MVYKNLQIEEDVPFVVIVSMILKMVFVEGAFVVPNALSLKNTFPVVQKQWDAISQFKLHIIQRAENHLKNTNCGAQVKIIFFNMRC